MRLFSLLRYVLFNFIKKGAVRLTYKFTFAVIPYLYC